ncbi:MAG: hypothetical protein ACOC2W_04150 [bacterium]
MDNFLTITVSLIFFIIAGFFIYNDYQTDNDFDISKGLHNNLYYAELFDPIYYSYGYEEYKNIYKQPSLKKYDECAEYNLDLYPENFLTELEKSQKAHNVYFKNPTHDNAHNMIDKQYDTAFAYIKDNERFLQSLLDIDDDINFIMSNNKIISLQDMRDYFKYNIENGYAMVDKINERSKTYLHSNYSSYNLEDIPNFQLSNTDTINKKDILTKNEALKMFKIYVNASKDDIKTQKKLDDYTIDDLFLAKIPLSCYDEYVPVYGVDDDIYANMFYANIYGETGVVEDYKYRDEWYMPFAACMCPFVEEDRINWYLIKDVAEELKTNEYLGQNIIEQKFIDSPTYLNLGILSDYYESEIKKAFLNNKITPITNNMWHLFNKINTKYYLYNEVYDVIDVYESMSYFEDSSDNVCEEYQNYVIVESMFHLNYMRWSKSVFILDDTILLDDYTERQYSVNITDEKEFIYGILHN